MLCLFAGAALGFSACDEPGPQSRPAPAEPAAARPEAPAPTGAADIRPDKPAPGQAGASGLQGASELAGDMREHAMSTAPAERPRVATRTEDFHVDQRDAPAPRNQPAPRAAVAERAAAAERQPLHVKLLSTPSGALAAVDGVSIGRTPAFWQGEFTGKAREFTFVLPGHAMARYRFVPTTSGVVHGTLVKLAVEPKTPPARGSSPAAEPTTRDAHSPPATTP